MDADIRTEGSNPSPSATPSGKGTYKEYSERKWACSNDHKEPHRSPMIVQPLP